MNSGPALFFDGQTARPLDVRIVVYVPTEVRILDEDGSVLAKWPCPDIRMIDAPTGVLRLRLEHDDGARLEVREPMLAQTLMVGCPFIRDHKKLERSATRKIVGWSLAACVSLVLLAVYGVPAIAQALIPVIPLSVDRQIGVGVKQGIVQQLSKGKVCEPDEAARDALKTMTDRLVVVAGDVPEPLDVSVLPSKIPNALALPGSNVILLDGLIQAADTPDEVAAVLAHELGHVAGRHSMRNIVSEAGLYFLLGVVLGDFTGGTLIIGATRVLLSAGYSRDVEREADTYAIRVMQGAGADPTALATLLERISTRSRPGAFDLISSHPATAERSAAIRDQAEVLRGDGTYSPILNDKQWKALKSFCSDGK